VRGFVHARHRVCRSFAARPGSEAARLTHLISRDLQHLRNSWRQQLKILKEGVRPRTHPSVLQQHRPAPYATRALPQQKFPR
jgi:hypothetical protein